MPNQQWAYHVILSEVPTSHERAIEAAGMLSDWGLQGWELVSAATDTGRGKMVYVMKRPGTERAAL